MDNWLKTEKLKANTSPKQTEQNLQVDSNDSATETCEEIINVDFMSTPSGEISKGNLKACKNQKYDESYLNFGFTWISKEAEPNALCLECEKVVSNSSLNPVKLRRHF